jgi:hypothetical protein
LAAQLAESIRRLFTVADQHQGFLGSFDGRSPSCVGHRSKKDRQDRYPYEAFGVSVHGATLAHAHAVRKN